MRRYNLKTDIGYFMFDFMNRSPSCPTCIEQFYTAPKGQQNSFLQAVKNEVVTFAKINDFYLDIFYASKAHFIKSKDFVIAPVEPTLS